MNKTIDEPALIHCPVKESAPLPAYDMDEILPLAKHLARDEKATETIVFPRGTLMPDGRLDLCKQSLGVAGCRQVMQALQGNSQVKALLLGTDGIGDEGAGQVANLIQHNAHLETIYLGCNRIGASGAQAIAQALERNQTVRGLWLKRNPIGEGGALALAKMLGKNQTLRTLDLVNTQFNERGFAALLEALAENSTLQRLYLGSNGITSRGAAMLADLLRANANLKALLLNVNHIGDEGAKALAETLKQNRTLEELGLASNDIGSSGIVALLQAAAGHPRLRSLDLGYSRSTKVMEASANQLSDEDVPKVAASLQTNRVLQYLDLRRTGLSELAKEGLVTSLEENQTLCELWLPGKQSPQLKQLLERNRTQQNDVMPNRDVALIKSVYR